MGIVITKDPNVVFLFWWHGYDNVIPCILSSPIVCGLCGSCMERGISTAPDNIQD